MARFSHQEVTAMLDLSGELEGVRRTEALPELLLRHMVELVDCEFAGCHWINLKAAQVTPHYLPQLSNQPCHQKGFITLVGRHPLQQRLSARPLRAWQNTDVISQAAFSRSEFFNNFYRPLGIDHELTALVPAASSLDPELVVSFHRRRRRFDQRDRALVDLALPAVVRAQKRLYSFSTSSRAEAIGGLELHVFSELAQAHPSWNLNPREIEVLFWLCQGKTNREIGTLLGISPRTSETHALNAYPKMGVENRYSAIVALLELVERARAATFNGQTTGKPASGTR